MYMERILKEAKEDLFMELDRHKWPGRVQCQICGCIVRRSNKARHLTTTKHWQCKYIWTDRFEITRFRGQPAAS